jgi:hypothetical protein
MTIKFIAKEAMPTYLALSTDITSGSVLGVSLIGKTI